MVTLSSITVGETKLWVKGKTEILVIQTIITRLYCTGIAEFNLFH